MYDNITTHSVSCVHQDLVIWAVMSSVKWQRVRCVHAIRKCYMDEWEVSCNNNNEMCEMSHDWVTCELCTWWQELSDVRYLGSKLCLWWCEVSDLSCVYDGVRYQIRSDMWAVYTVVAGVGQWCFTGIIKMEIGVNMYYRMVNYFVPQWGVRNK